MKFRETAGVKFSPIDLKTYTKFDGVLLAITLICGVVFSSVISLGISFVLPYLIFRYYRVTPIASLIGAILVLAAVTVLFVFLFAHSLAGGRV